MMNQGRKSSPASQKDKGQNTPLTIQPCNHLYYHHCFSDGHWWGPHLGTQTLPDFTKDKHIEAFSTQAPLAIRAIESRPHNTPAKRANSTTQCKIAQYLLPSTGSPSRRVCSRTTTLPYLRNRREVHLTLMKHSGQKLVHALRKTSTQRKSWEI